MLFSEAGVWLGAVGLILLVGSNGLIQGGSSQRRDRVENGSGIDEPLGVVPDRWLGLDLPCFLNGLSTLTGDTVHAGNSGLRLWIVIRDRECVSCLDEIPFIASLLDSLDIEGLDAVTVALGDRYEARRTLWGLDTGMPVWVSARTGLLEAIGVDTTPLRIVTWHGRIVGLSEVEVYKERGLYLLHDLLRRWSRVD